MKIAIIGTGYVGLPTGVGFAELGHEIICIDKDFQKIADLNAGKITLFEDGLECLFNKNLSKGKIKFSTDIARVRDVDFIIMAVGTPPNPETKQADLTYVYAAAAELAPHLTGYTAVSNKSTVPVGTCDEIEKIIRKTNPSADFDVISMPEFLREGFAVHDFFNPDRIVVGIDADRARAAVERLYSVFPERPDILFTDRRSAELIKYASNAFLAVKIHYINEISNLCEKVGANVYEVSKGMGMDSRIGSKFLTPGPGYGGSCFPKDTNALDYMARQVGLNLSLVNNAIKGNDIRKAKMAERILNSVRDIDAPKIAVWGLAFKGGTDDVRESPALAIVQELVRSGADVTAFDPKAMDNAREILGDSINYADNAAAAADGADVLAVLTEWVEFGVIGLETLNMRRKSIVDLRNMIDSKRAAELGFQYRRLGDV